MSIRICARCVMDETDPGISFDADGVCSHCIEFETLQRPRLKLDLEGEALLAQHVQRIKTAGLGRPYDCIIGLSGGVDSSFVALRVVELGLRPLAVHVDTGWNSELAVGNIQRIVERLRIDLHTVVIDWDEMRDLQLAFFKAGIANCDVPQDHAFVAVLYRTAAKHGVRSLISGHNLATEAVLPEAWGYTSIDRRHLFAIHKAHGSRPLRRFPTYSLFEYTFWWPYVRGLKIFPILDYGPLYDKAAAKARLAAELDWRDYGGKHHESRFTKFFQSYYLPHKFGFDKRKAHLSSLIVAGQMSRADARAELEKPPYDPATIDGDIEFVAKKLGVRPDEFRAILSAPPRTHLDYQSNAVLIERLLRFKTRARDLTRRWTHSRTSV